MRLTASTRWDGSTFKSPQITPAEGIRIEVPIYARGGRLEDLRVLSLRMSIEPSEGHMFYAQMWTLSATGSQAIDTAALPGEAYREGLPIEMPVKARSLSLQSDTGDSKIINSTAYWKGVITPGQPVTLQLLYSMTAKSDELVYAQRLDYPVDRFELIIPLETRHKNKLPRLHGLELRAPEFKPEEIQSGFNIPGLRPDREFIYAERHDLSAGETIRFKLYNLPYGRSLGPWIALGLGLLGALCVFAFARRERAAGKERERHVEALLREELDALIEERRELELELEQGAVSEREHELESQALHHRIALLLKKLEERGEAHPDAEPL